MVTSELIVHFSRAVARSRNEWRDATGNQLHHLSAIPAPKRQSLSIIATKRNESQIEITRLRPFPRSHANAPQKLSGRMTTSKIVWRQHSFARTEEFFLRARGIGSAIYGRSVKTRSIYYCLEINKGIKRTGSGREAAGVFSSGKWGAISWSQNDVFSAFRFITNHLFFPFQVSLTQSARNWTETLGVPVSRIHH